MILRLPWWWMEHLTPNSYLHWHCHTECCGLTNLSDVPTCLLKGVRSCTRIIVCVCVCALYRLFMARVDTAYAGEISLCRKSPGTVLREWRTPHECVFTTHTASRLHLNSCSVLSLSLQPWAPCAASHSPIELASLGAAIHWISWPLFPWIQCLTVPP